MSADKFHAPVARTWYVRPGIRRRYSFFLLLAAMAAACVNQPAVAHDPGQEAHPPAGQMCPAGEYVIGFDADGNIVCSGRTPSPAPVVGAQADSPLTSAPESSGGDQAGPAAAAAHAPAAEQVSPRPVIDDLSPSSVVYGRDGIEVVISGTGFSQQTVVRFQGQELAGKVNESGTSLTVRLPTRELPIGSYAVTVSNGPGLEHTLKRALDVF
jgi:hypothetical protein